MTKRELISEIKQIANEIIGQMSATGTSKESFGNYLVTITGNPRSVTTPNFINWCATTKLWALEKRDKAALESAYELMKTSKTRLNTYLEVQ